MWFIFLASEQTNAENHQYKCGDCNKKFNSITELETHVDETRYECVRCKVSFTEIWELKIHQLRHNDNQWYEESNQNDLKVEMDDVNDNMEATGVKVEKETCPNTDVKKEINFTGNSYWILLKIIYI